VKIAIIGGAGKMGHWLARFLVQNGFEIILADRNKTKLDVACHELGVMKATTKNAIKESDIILFSVPIEQFESIIKEASNFIRAGQTVIDVTSIKVEPVKIMHKHIKNGTILGSHPLFGPGARDIVNLNIVLTPTDKNEDALAQKVKEYLEEHKANITIMTPEEHDEMMAVILGLSHYVALIVADTLSDFNTKILDNIGGITYKLLLTLVHSVISEDPDFYGTLQMSLPKLSQLQDKLIDKAELWSEMVRKKDKDGFTRRMKRLKKILNKDSDLFQSYEDMYKIAQGLQIKN
jgi:prephenate dehydrogenase